MLPITKLFLYSSDKAFCKTRLEILPTEKMVHTRTAEEKEVMHIPYIEESIA